MESEIIEKLRQELATEKLKNAQLQEDLKHVKEQSIEMQIRAEQEEEYITNKLTKRLEQLKHEKEKLVQQVEQEEEHLTNTLQKKLRQLEIDKIELQKQLEQEEEFIVNKLQKQLQQLTQEKNELRKRLQESGQGLITTLHAGVQRFREVETSLGPEQSLLNTSESMDLVRKMSNELDILHKSQEAFKQERDSYKKKVEEYEEKLKESDHQNTILKQKYFHEHEQRKLLVERACLTEQSLELNIEREINAVRRGSSSSPRGDALLISPLQSPRLFHGQITSVELPPTSDLDNLAKVAHVRSPRRNYTRDPSN
eukprot:c11487_g1_i1.p1 GENE.c11487_g1_i1~~c11487_g1_i1.p1  ORF type:complete len:322 (+),score=136.34 c11487_g1_i1:33-968(+)